MLRLPDDYENGFLLSTHWTQRKKRRELKAHSLENMDRDSFICRVGEKFECHEIQIKQSSVNESMLDDMTGIDPNDLFDEHNNIKTRENTFWLQYNAADMQCFSPQQKLEYPNNFTDRCIDFVTEDGEEATYQELDLYFLFPALLCLTVLSRVR